LFAGVGVHDPNAPAAGRVHKARRDRKDARHGFVAQRKISGVQQIPSPAAAAAVAAAVGVPPEADEVTAVGADPHGVAVMRQGPRRRRQNRTRHFCALLRVGCRVNDDSVRDNELNE